MDLSLFDRHRFWIKSLKTGATSSGWIAADDSEHLKLTFNTPIPEESEDRWIVSVTTTSGTFQFLIRLFDIDGLTASGKIDSRMNLIEATETPRYLHQKSETIVIDGERMLADVVDISPGGVGLKVPFAIPVGSTVEIEIEDELGPIQLSGSVVQTFQDPADSMFFRSGVALSPMSRLVHAQWHIYLRKGERIIALDRSKAS